MYFWVMLGSALGGGLRYLLSGLAAAQIGETFPLGKLIVNVTGSFVIGVFAALTGPAGRLLVSTEARQFVMTVVCGGLACDNETRLAANPLNQLKGA